MIYARAPSSRQTTRSPQSPWEAPYEGYFPDGRDNGYGGNLHCGTCKSKVRELGPSTEGAYARYQIGSNACQPVQNGLNSQPSMVASLSKKRTFSERTHIEGDGQSPHHKSARDERNNSDSHEMKRQLILYNSPRAPGVTYTPTPNG